LTKTIALVAHDNCKPDLLEWAEFNFKALSHHCLVCTGTTGKLLEDVLTKKLRLEKRFRLTKLKSGPLGGDQQLGALVSEGKIDCLIFFWDPMQPQPHDVDVKALLRIAVAYNVPTACNRATADFVISSPLMMDGYEPTKPDFSKYLARNVGE